MNERTDQAPSGFSPAALIVGSVVDRPSRGYMNARIVFFIAVLALMGSACQSQAGVGEPDAESHEHLELEEVPDGQQAYEIKDGRTGWRRVPLIDVSATELVDYANIAAGEPFVPVAQPGELLLLFFGYTSCPDVCPTTLADYRAAFDQLPPDLASRIAFGMVSIDPERDDATQVTQYVSQFIDDGHALLAADEAALAAAAETFAVEYQIEAHEAGATDYLVGHTATVFAIDEDGHIIWEFGYPIPSGDIAAALTDLLDERY